MQYHVCNLSGLRYNNLNTINNKTEQYKFVIEVLKTL